MKVEEKYGLRSRQMHDETEMPGEFYDRDTLRVIKTRYEFAAKYIRSKRVLEIGTGPGLGSRYFNEVALEYVATEYSDENIQLFNRYNRGSSIVKASATDLPFEDNSFDSVVALAMIYYLDVRLFFRECARVIARKGELIFCSTNRDVPGFVQAPFTLEYHSVQELTQMLEGEGFDVSVYGSFRRPYRSLFASYSRNFIKTILKSCWLVVPGGRASWGSLRQVVRGARHELPADVRLICEDAEILTPIEKRSANRDFRVVYFVATLR